MDTRRWSVARLAKAIRQGAARRSRSALSNHRHLGLESLETRLCLSEVAGPLTTATYAGLETTAETARVSSQSESLAAVEISCDQSDPYRVGDVAELTALATGGTGDCEYAFWLRPVDGEWTLVRDWGPDPAWLWDTWDAAVGEYEIQVKARPMDDVEGQVVDSVGVSVRENADQLWARVIEPYLADDLWIRRDAYDAAHHLMVPLHVAFSSGRRDWQDQFADYYQRMMDAGMLSLEFYETESGCGA